MNIANRSVTSIEKKVDSLTFQQYYEFKVRLSLEMFQDLMGLYCLDGEEEIKKMLWEDILASRSELLEANK